MDCLYRLCISVSLALILALTMTSCKPATEASSHPVQPPNQTATAQQQPTSTAPVSTAQQPTEDSLKTRIAALEAENASLRTSLAEAQRDHDVLRQQSQQPATSPQASIASSSEKKQTSLPETSTGANQTANKQPARAKLSHHPETDFIDDPSFPAFFAEYGQTFASSGDLTLGDNRLKDAYRSVYSACGQCLSSNSTEQSQGMMMLEINLSNPYGKQAISALNRYFKSAQRK